ncbi:MAG: stage III sporulation protein AF [Clostridiales bacterium]|jgi:hypothetical protein|nr:stage III sporulation protein AF [Clostridiales bacterium]
MLELSNYIRNLAVFLIFASFVTIITPGKKYEKYLNLVLGIILIFIITAPLAGVINALAGSSGDIFADISLAYDRAAMAAQIDRADQEGREAILALYREGLTDQTRRLIDSHGEFSLVAANFQIDTENNFGEILSMHLILAPTQANTPFLRIEPIRIPPTIDNRGEPATQASDNVESPHIMSLKNLLAGFYNLALDNIILETID